MKKKKPADGEEGIFYQLYDSRYLTKPESALLFSSAESLPEIIENRDLLTDDFVIVRSFAKWNQKQKAYIEERTETVSKEEIAECERNTLSKFTIEELLNPVEEFGPLEGDVKEVYLIYPKGYDITKPFDLQPLSQHQSFEDAVNECTVKQYPKGCILVVKETISDPETGDILHEEEFELEEWDPKNPPDIY